MKKLIQSIRQLGAKAGQFREAMESAPDQAAEWQNAFRQTVGQLQTLRTEVEADIMDLKSPDDDSLVGTLASV